MNQTHIVWGGQPRRIAWSVISHMRISLKLELHPVISTSFMVLHNYYEFQPESTYQLYIRIISAVFAVCKQFEMTRSMQMILSSLLGCCREFKDKMNPATLQQISGLDDFADRQISNSEINLINSCEMDLIEANGYSVKLELPFNYTHQYVVPFLPALNNEQITKSVEGVIIRSLCVILCSEHCSDYPPEIMAVAATVHSLQNFEVPHSIGEWIQRVTEKCGTRKIEDAKKLLDEQIKEIISPQKQ